MKTHKTLSRWLFAVIYVSVIAVAVLLDQLTKIFIFDKLLEARPGNGIDVLGKFLRFYATYNAGASFGIGKSDAANIVFFIVTLLGIPGFCYLLWRSRTRSVLGQVGFAFIVGGTIGNAIDRAFINTSEGKFFSGQVRDFISFSIFPPIFNIADSFLVIGVFLAVLALVFFDPDALVPSFKSERSEAKLAAEQKNEGEGDSDENASAAVVVEAEQAVQSENEQRSGKTDNVTETGGEE